MNSLPEKRDPSGCYTYYQVIYGIYFSITEEGLHEEKFKE